MTGVIMMNTDVKNLRDSINEKNESYIYYNLRKLLVKVSWSDDSYEDLESVADALYDFLMEQKHVKDAFISGN